MAKEKAIPVQNPENTASSQFQPNEQKAPNEPLSGSKSVKNRNHSRDNHGEGS